MFLLFSSLVKKKLASVSTSYECTSDPWVILMIERKWRHAYQIEKYWDIFVTEWPSPLVVIGQVTDFWQTNNKLNNITFWQLLFVQFTRVQYYSELKIWQFIMIIIIYLLRLFPLKQERRFFLILFATLSII